MTERVELLDEYPLQLWGGCPGLELILEQEGVAFRVIDPVGAPTDASLGGRYLIVDRRRVRERDYASCIGRDHVVIDQAQLCGRDDALKAVLDTRGGLQEWELGVIRPRERIARCNRAGQRAKVVSRLRLAIEQVGGTWIRLAPFPHPYRSAFNLRLDLDEPVPEDYLAFSRMRSPIESSCTHFISTAAYGEDATVLRDLQGLDAQSHAHFHTVSRDKDWNRGNVERAHLRLLDSGFEPVGFAAPTGRWNPGLDEVLEDLGYLYASEFQVGYDDLPFRPWRNGKFSGVLQVPIHPVCEGVILEAGGDESIIADYLADVIRRKVAAGMPAFVYGHPERRLGRLPGVMEAIISAADEVSEVWKTTLTEFARWWTYREGVRWSARARGSGLLEIEGGSSEGPWRAVLEISSYNQVARVVLPKGRTTLRLDQQDWKPLPQPSVTTAPRPVRRSPSLRRYARELLDWERVTPVDELPIADFRSRIKKGLRQLRPLSARTEP